MYIYYIGVINEVGVGLLLSILCIQAMYKGLAYVQFVGSCLHV